MKLQKLPPPLPASPEDKRRYTRYAVSIPAGVYLRESPHEVYDAEIIDISEGGAFVHCVAPIQMGNEVLIEIRYAETKLFDGKVVPHDALKDAGNGKKEESVVKWIRGSQKSGFGVEFTGMRVDKKDFLQKLIRYFTKLKNAGASYK